MDTKRKSPPVPHEISAKQNPQPIIDRTQTVFRRARWENLKPGTVLNVLAALPRYRWQPRKSLAYIEVTAVRRELVRDAKMEDIIAEGYGHYDVNRYITAYCLMYYAEPDDECTVIKFKYISPQAYHKARKVQALDRTLEGIVVYQAIITCGDGSRAEHYCPSLAKAKEWLKTEALRLHWEKREPQQGIIDRCEVVSGSMLNAAWLLSVLNQENWLKYRLNVGNYNLVVK